jgi:hypothetical protein
VVNAAAGISIYHQGRTGGTICSIELRVGNVLPCVHVKPALKKNLHVKVTVFNQ